MGAAQPSRFVEGSAQTLSFVVRVVPDVSGIDKTFDYLVPERFGSVDVGTIVRVPLNGRRVDAWVIERVVSHANDESYELKEILDVASIGPAADVVALASWCARRFAGPLRAVLSIASPPNRVKRVTRRVTASKGASRTTLPEIDHLRSLGGGVVVWPPLRPWRQLLESALMLGRTLVVCPGVSTARTIAVALRREGFTVALMPDDWQRAAEGVDVVVGARSAVWAPCNDLRAVVVLDEHDERLQDERSPTWHARDVAIERARRAGAPCLVVSPIPTVSACEWAGESRTVALSGDDAGWPKITVVDPHTGLGDDEAPRTGLLSSSLIVALRDPSKVVACVLNVKGRARLVACKSCREIARCERCDAAMVLGNGLECPACKHHRPEVCSKCGAGAFALLRKGVSRAREEIEAAAGRPVVEVTGEMLEPANNAGAVYIGTEAMLHRLNAADVVAFLDFDNEVFAPTYRAGEHAWSLVVLASRLVRGAVDAKIILQSNDATNPVVAAFAGHDVSTLIQAESEKRRLLQLPPFSFMARVVGDEAGSSLLSSSPLGVSVAPVRAGEWLIRANDEEQFVEFCGSLRGGNFRVYSDPQRY